MARCHRQHAGRVRYPDKPSCDRLLLLTLRFLQLERGRGNRNSGYPRLSFFFFAKKFFRDRAGLADSGIGLQRTQTQFGFGVTLANEADRFEYSGSWLAARRSFGLTFSPPSPLFGTPAFCLCAKRTLYPPFRSSGAELRWADRLQVYAPQLQRLARGKSYPVTAAQLLRLHTGFLAPIHCFKLAKNCSSNSGLRFRVQDLFSQARFPRAFFLCQQLTQN